MKTFIASISALLVLAVKSDELATEDEHTYLRSQDVLQLEAETVEQAADDALAEARRRWPEAEGYTDHYAYARPLQITSTLCFEVAEFAENMAEMHMQKGHEALASMSFSVEALTGIDDMRRTVARAIGSAVLAMRSGDGIKGITPKIHASTVALSSLALSFGHMMKDIAQPTINVAALMQSAQPINSNILFSIRRSDKKPE